MWIKCIANKATDLLDERLNPSVEHDKKYIFPLEIGKVYNVYAITIYEGYIWYYVCDEVSSYYPTWKPSPLFDVVDGHISKYWRFNYVRGNSTWPEDTVIFAFKEWADDPNNYYLKLIDDEKEEVDLFRLYKDLMDLEFPNPSIDDKADDLGDNWIKCPVCDEAWQDSGITGMVKCLKCGMVLHNPLYQEGKR